MEKTLTIGGRQVKFKSSGAFLLRYKAQFGRDAVSDISKLEKFINNGNTDFSAFDVEILFSLIWVLAKTADPGIPSDPFEWLDSFDEFPIADIFPELVDMLYGAFRSTKKK